MTMTKLLTVLMTVFAGLAGLLGVAHISLTFTPVIGSTYETLEAGNRLAVDYFSIGCGASLLIIGIILLAEIRAAIPRRFTVGLLTISTAILGILAVLMLGPAPSAILVAVAGFGLLICTPLWLRSGQSQLVRP
jgi:hypothetical protein